MASSLRKSLLISFSQTYVIFAMQFIASLIIARLLTPHEFGVFSVSLVFIGMGNTLRDFGVVEYIVQEKNLTEQRIRAASMLTFITAWSIALIIWLVSKPVATFYGEPDVALIMRILSINFFLVPFGSVVMAHLRRQMEFARIAKIRLAGAFTQVILSVTLAYLGFSYFSMAWAAVAASAINIFLTQFVRPKGFPFLPSFKGLRHIFTFGSFSSIRVLIQDADKGAPDLILGRLVNMEAVAFFGRATGLIDLFHRLVVQAVNHATLPHLAARVRAGEDLSESYLRSITYITGVAWPFYAFLAMFSWILIPALYGDQWIPSVVLAQILCLGEILLVPFYLQEQLFVSHGLVRREALRTLLITLIKLLPLILLTPYGLQAVAIGYAASSLFTAGISFIMLTKLIQVDTMQLLNSCRSSLIVSVVVMLVLSSAALWLSYNECTIWVTLALAGSSLAVGWLAGIFLVRHPLWKDCLQLLNSLHRHFRKTHE